MKLEINNGTFQQNIDFSRWFFILCKELNIEHKNAIVDLTLKHDEMPGRTGLAGGSFCPVPTADRRLFMLINTNQEEMLPSFCHEMVHVKQVVTGENVVSQNSIMGSWHGKLYEIAVVEFLSKLDYEFYRTLPWEKEAFDKMHILAELVRRQM